MFEDNPMLIVISDVHLGGADALPEKFYEFLLQIKERHENNSKFRKNLKALLILGDFYDLLMNSSNNIAELFEQTFRLLDELYEKGILILETLGNHEFSVIGPFNTRFNARKKRFYSTISESFEKLFFKWNYFTLQNFCQYFVLTRNLEERQWELVLYDSINEFGHQERAVRKIQLGKCPKSKDNYNVFMTHGFQFFPNQSQFFGTLVWTGLLKAPLYLKEATNIMYNQNGIRDLIANGTAISDKYFVQAFKKWKENDEKRKVRFFEKNNLINKELMKTILSSMNKLDKAFAKLVNDQEKIGAFFTKGADLRTFNKIIFGHTHKAGHFSIDNLDVFNTGAWQHVEKPTYIEILQDGSINLYEMN